MILDESNFDEKIKSGVALVDFYATWCPPCNAIAPTVDKIEKEYQDKALVAKVNVSESSDLADRFGITAIPTFIFFKDGQVVKKTMGIMNEKLFKEELDKLLG